MFPPNTTPGQPFYPLPEQFLSIIRVGVKDRKLREINPGQMRRQINNNKRTGKPEVYSVVENHLVIYPIPTKEYALYVEYVETREVTNRRIDHWRELNPRIYQDIIILTIPEKHHGIGLLRSLQRQFNISLAEMKPDWVIEEPELTTNDLIEDRQEDELDIG